MIQIKNLTVRNFMSVGNSTQAINFDRKDLTLVLGENLDLGGDGSRNGTGKTTIINALSYVIFGQALSNIKKDNLVNKTNGKQMLVSVDFRINDTEYRIERGRKPNVLKFYVNKEQLAVQDDSQGDSRETQEKIEQTFGMSHDMFKHIMALNTYTEPFLGLRANDQRTIIEQLLGITQLSERADRIKELNRETKELIQKEEVRIRATQDANKRIEEQIDSLRKRQTLWLKKRDEDCENYTTAITELERINIDLEIQSHRDLEQYNTKRNAINDLNTRRARAELDQAREEKDLAKLILDITSLENHTCHSCGHAFHDNEQVVLLDNKRKELAQTKKQLAVATNTIIELNESLSELGELGTIPTVFYDVLEDALNHRNRLETLRQNLLTRSTESDPYSDQIVEMEKVALQIIDYNLLNELTRLQDHQDFLLKLLTSKDSFIRKRIIEQNLSYLNNRLTWYLDRIGLPHQVLFQNDLTVEISELGRELDFDNLSRGERNRLILSLSWAFRDVWESLYQPINVLFIDEMIDSGLDTSGVENSLAILKKMCRERSKSVWLVSHRDELASRVENILKVVKENGFTSYSTDIDTP